MAPPKRSSKRAKAPAVVLVSVRELCGLLAGKDQEPLSEMRISQLVGEGMPKAGHGKYEPLTCMHWYLGKLRPAVQRKATETDDGTPRNLTDERARLTAAQADAAEMDRDERRGSLIPVEVYEQRLVAWALNTKQNVLALTTRLPSKLEAQPRDKIRAILDAALKGVLVHVATGRPMSDDGPRPGTRSKPKSRR